MVIKESMNEWYNNGTYTLTSNGEYSATRSYNSKIGAQQRLREADLIWSSIMLPRHRFIVWLAHKE